EVPRNTFGHVLPRVGIAAGKCVRVVGVYTRRTVGGERISLDGGLRRRHIEARTFLLRALSAERGRLAARDLALYLRQADADGICTVRINIDADISGFAACFARRFGRRCRSATHILPRLAAITGILLYGIYAFL